MPQTSMQASPDKGSPGLIAYGDSVNLDIISTLVEDTADIAPGLCVVRGIGGDRTARLPLAVAADVDSLIVTLPSSGIQVVYDSAGEFDGAVSLGRLYQPKRVVLVLDAQADWDATTATLVYEDENGLRVTELMSIPNGGNATVTSDGFASAVISLTVPAQTGAGGSATLGNNAEASFNGSLDVLGISVLTAKTISSSSSDNENYEDEDQMPVLKEGCVWVECETDFEAGQQALVRSIAGGSGLGAIRAGDTDSGDCFAWERARFRTSGSAGELGVLELRRI